MTPPPRPHLAPDLALDHGQELAGLAPDLTSPRPPSPFGEGRSQGARSRPSAHLAPSAPPDGGRDSEDHTWTGRVVPASTGTVVQCDCGWYAPVWGFDPKALHTEHVRADHPTTTEESQ